MKEPTIVIYRFPNNELKYFLISKDNHLIDSISNSLWYNSFPFIRPSHSNSVLLNIDNIKPVEINECIAWLPQNQNYSHFLCDFFAPWTVFDPDKYRKSEDPFLLDIQGFSKWQAPFISSLNMQSMKLELDSSSNLYVLKPKSVTIPIVSSVLLTQIYLKNWLRKNYIDAYKDLPFLESVPILMISNNDAKFNCITNHQELCTFVDKKGGTIIDASKLSIREKIRIIGCAKNIICQGSGTLNAVLFGTEKSNTVILSNPSNLDNPFMLEGGFPYGHLMRHRSTTCVGTEALSIHGSPIGAANYSVERINSYLS